MPLAFYNITYLGKILKKFGSKGAVICWIDHNEPDLFYDVEYLFIDAVPYKIQYREVREEDLLLVKFEDILTPEETLVLIGKEVCCEKKFFPETTDTITLDQRIVGCRIIDKNEGDIGIIHSLIQQNEQILLQVINQGKEILIPAVEAFVRKIDLQKKLIKTDLPSGLININP